MVPKGSASNAPRGGRDDLGERLVDVALLCGLFMVPGALGLGTIAAKGGAIALVAILLVARSPYLAWTASFAMALAFRLQPREPWLDQTFVQLHSITELLSGHGIYYPYTSLGLSWSIYLPMGNLLAAFPIGFLGTSWPLFFQVFVLLVASLPFLSSPSRTTFRLFLLFAAFAPFAGVTTLGSALELSTVAPFAGFWLLLRGRRLALAGALLGWAALLRQPLLFLVPFVAIALWRHRSRRGLATFGGVLFFGGFVHFARNPFGFFDATFGIWPAFADQWFHKLGARGNWSISTLLRALGDTHAMDRSRQPVYLALLAVALLGLLVFAWRSRSVARAVACAILAVVLVHLLNRGFVHVHYLLAAFAPALAFVGLGDGRELDAEGGRDDGGETESAATRPLLAGLASRLFGALVAVAIVALVATPLALAAVGELRSHAPSPGRPLEIARLWQGERELLGILRPDAPPAAPVRVGEEFRIDLAAPGLPRELRIAGGRIPPTVVDGVFLVYPSDAQVAGFPRSARVEGSGDGVDWHDLGSFRTWIHPSVFPLRVPLDPGGRPVRYLRLVETRTAWPSDAWLLGGLEVLGEPAS